jgi:hypothetical protein
MFNRSERERRKLKKAWHREWDIAIGRLPSSYDSSSMFPELNAKRAATFLSRLFTTSDYLW